MPPTVPTKAVAEETSAHEANRMLRDGWRLLQVIHAHDGIGAAMRFVCWAG